MWSEPNPSDERQNRPPRRYWQARIRPHWLEFALGIGLLVVGGAQVLIYLRQASIMQTQATIMIDQLSFQESVSRAWIRANISLIDPVIFTEWANDKFINVRLKFDLKNFGPVPAVNTIIMTSIEPFGDADRKPRLDKVQEIMCRNAREIADNNKIGGTTAFPQEEKTVESGSGRGGLYKDGNPMDPFAVLGCIDYTYANSKHGQTGFRKILGRVENKLVVGIPFVSGEPDLSQGAIPPELLVSGFPKEPPRVAKVPSEGLYFRDANDGDYAK